MKNICIFSEDGDASSSKVMEWLWYHHQIKCTRLNSNNKPVMYSVRLSNSGDTEAVMTFEDGRKIDLSDFDFFWYRRGDFSIKVPFSSADIKNKNFERLIDNETNTLRSFIFQSCQHKTLLGSFTAELERRKLTDLIAAKGCGLKIPETTITNNRNELKLFLDKYGKAITKPIHSHINVDLGSHIYASTGTRLVAASDIEQLDEIFAPVLLQEYLEKDIEIRVFFSGEAYFPMAIFSQGNEKTSIDYRNYDDERPNRNVPFSLPEDILAKLIKFNKQINLNTGSIDLIITKNGDYYFLEINPNGIFDDLSVKCNYFIEESIACQIAKHVKEPI